MFQLKKIIYIKERIEEKKTNELLHDAVSEIAMDLARMFRTVICKFSEF